jgi:protein CLEC16A
MLFSVICSLTLLSFLHFPAPDYLLSNNHVNSIIVHKFDFSDEEVMAYYISFLKTLSFKLNTHTIHFFFNEHTNDFPLYTEAIKFFNHSEKMVRIAVRTLTLNVFRVEETSMLKFITDRTAVPYFSNLVWFIGNHVLEIDKCLRLSPQTQQTVVKLDDLVAEHLDHLHYLNDILLLQIADLNAVLTEHLLNRLLIPLYIFSLIEAKSSNRSADDSQSSSCDDKKIRISRLVSLFLLSQVFLIVSFKPLVCDLLNIVQNGSLSLFNNPEFTAPSETLEESLFQVSRSSPNPSRCENEEEQVYPSSDVSNMTEEDCESSNPVISESEGSDEPMNTVSEPDTRPITDEEKAAAANPNLATRWSQRLTDRPFLHALFQCLQCNQTSDDHTFIFALCLIYAMVHNKGMHCHSL